MESKLEINHFWDEFLIPANIEVEYILTLADTFVFSFPNKYSPIIAEIDGNLKQYKWSFNKPDPEIVFNVSSFKTWNDFGNFFYQKYIDKIDCNIDTPLSSLTESLIFLNSFTAADFSDSESNLFPRKLSRILKNKKGDCKDKSLLLYSLLRKFYNNKIFFGLIYDRENISNIPSPVGFSHSVIAVENANGSYKIFDPVNENAVLKNNLLNRFCLILNPDDIHFIKILKR